MKMFLYIFLVWGFSLIIISCGEVEESTTTDTATTDTTTTSENDSSDDASNLVVTMASLTIGSQTYSNAFTLVGRECLDHGITVSSNGDKIYFLETHGYSLNKQKLFKNIHTLLKINGKLELFKIQWRPGNHPKKFPKCW